MAYWLSSFDGLALPVNLGSSGSHDLTLGERRSPLVSLPGGVYDPDGAGISARRQSQLSARVLIVGATSAAVRTVLDSWQAKVGVRGLLVRADAAGNQQTITARLVSAQSTRDVSHVRHLPLALSFDVLSPVWSGAAHDVLTTLNTSPKTIVLPNGGNARVTAVKITLNPVGSAITNYWVTGTLTEWAYTGTIYTPLVVDTGALSVVYDGNDAYAGFARTANHKIGDWLRLEPGNNTVYVGIGGGGTTSTVRFEYSDAWS